jgi:hypothetical protein
LRVEVSGTLILSDNLATVIDICGKAVAVDRAGVVNRRVDWTRRPHVMGDAKDKT